MLNIPNFKSKWLTFVRQIIEETGKLDAWQNQTSLQNTTLKHEIKQVLIDQNLQHWQSILDQSTKARYYSIFKQNIQVFCYEVKSLKQTQFYVIYVTVLFISQLTSLQVK